MRHAKDMAICNTNNMKSILILGSTSDIGHALAKEYLNNGYTVMLAARNLAALDQQKKDLQTRFLEPHLQTLVFDGCAFDSHQSFYDSLNPKPDGVITVMGYLGEQKVSELSFKETQKVIDSNYTGNVSILNIIANDFEKRGHGFIVGVSSVAADRGRKSNYIYGSAKAGFTAYLSGLRNRLYSSNVHVLTVHPGFVDTKMTQHLTLPRRLTATPEHVASAIYKAQIRKKNGLYVKWIWKYIMLIIRYIPETLFKRFSL
jgi:decaprenylphospho-beta-D-erythro-pentofuranosid-2-ulose 2-reductase